MPDRPAPCNRSWRLYSSRAFRCHGVGRLSGSRSRTNHVFRKCFVVESPAMSAPADLKTQMNQLIRGYWTTQAIFVAAELGVADLLADGPKHPDELGKAAGVKGDMLYRVLRALA